MLPSQFAEGFCNSRVGHWVHPKICEMLEKPGPILPIARLHQREQTNA